MSRLANCPFCGGPVVAFDGHGDITYIACDEAPFGCGAIVSFRPYLKGGKAVEAFNRRTEAERDPSLTS